MLLALLLIAQDAAPGEPPRFAACMDLATSDPAMGQEDAISWRSQGGGAPARQCLGVAYANAGRFESAAASFADAAREAELAKSVKAADYWVQSGNAWLAAGDPAKARGDIDKALQNAPGDPLAWLLSATLARQTNDLERAKTDIAEALKRSADDASVQLEAGNIAAAARDEANARTHWTRAIELAPGGPMADSARKALEGLGTAGK